MKLSHLLIATLVSSSVIVSAQTDKPKTPKSKSKPKTAKLKTKQTAVKGDTLNLNASYKEPHYCPACGRG